MRAGAAAGGATALDTQSAASLDTRSRRSAFQAALSKRDDDTIEEPLA